MPSGATTLTRAQVPEAPRRRPHLLGEILIVVLLLEVYDWVRGLEEERAGAALRNGREVVHLERLLHLDVELAANTWLTRHDPLANAATWWYQLTHIGATMSVLVACYLLGQRIYRRARNALVATNVVGLTVFSLLPVMPPRLLPGTDYVDTIADAGFGTTHGGPVPADQYAAMPSLHLAWATWAAVVAVALLPRGPWRWLCLAYPLTTGVVVVATANHYVLDVVAGVGVALLALVIARTRPEPAAGGILDRLIAALTGWVRRLLVR